MPQHSVTIIQIVMVFKLIEVAITIDFIMKARIYILVLLLMNGYI